MDTIDSSLITATQKWLKDIIIEYRICPFAKRELDKGSIHFSINHDTDIEPAVLSLLLECDRLNIDPTIETTLIIFDALFTDFEDYLDFIELAENILFEQDYEGIYQLASFQPDYCFEGSASDDPANYTTRRTRACQRTRARGNTTKSHFITAEVAYVCKGPCRINRHTFR
jgi:hypothetical protein